NYYCYSGDDNVF
nr:immunoglobulin light chain junction region [Macaca mulatta]